MCRYVFLSLKYAQPPPQQNTCQCPDIDQRLDSTMPQKKEKEKQSNPSTGGVHLKTPLMG